MANENQPNQCKINVSSIRKQTQLIPMPGIFYHCFKLPHGSANIHPEEITEEVRCDYF
jgi:hypothetical protein